MHDLSQYWDLTVVLTKKEMKVRYKSSVLGYLWSIMNPLVFAFVFYVAFQLIMKIKMADFAVFLICGLFPWQWFSNSVVSSPTVFLTNATIIKKTSFPKSVIVLAIVIQDAIHFLLSLPVIVVFLFVFHIYPTFSWIYGVPLMLVLQFVITYGTALFIASLNLFLRDMERLTSTFMILFFYCTPVLYPDSMVPEVYRPLLYCNPMAPVILGWRSIFLSGHLNWTYFLISCLHAAVLFLVGYLVYRKLYWRFAEVL